MRPDQEVAMVINFAERAKSASSINIERNCTRRLRVGGMNHDKVKPFDIWLKLIRIKYKLKYAI